MSPNRVFIAKYDTKIDKSSGIIGKHKKILKRKKNVNKFGMNMFK